ncbi:SART-1 protein [Circinella umbellata]|nr:SART-1 protein [Circinella umbellata]
MAESISLEETNAIRAKLGLPTLGGGGGSDESEEQVIDRDQEAFENYQKQKEQEKKTKESEEIKARIEKSKNRKKDRAKLQGKGLGEADNNNDDSALDWIRKSRKRQKELAKKREREQAEMDQSFVSQASEYSASDLSGLKVGHDISEFAEGGETILTLKDRGILEEQEGDEHDAQEELTNVNLEDKERLQKNLENKKKKPGYNPYDDEEFVLGGKKKSLLPQYDEDTGPQGFQIGQQGRIEQEENKKKERESLSVSEKLKAQTLSYQKMQDIKDYYTQDEVNLGFKKPKKKKKKDKLRKRVKEQEDDQENINDDSTQPKTTTTTNGNDNVEQPKEQQLPKPKIIDTDTSFVDDDDLQMALARTRRAANRQREKKTKKLTPEEIARSIAAERSQENTQESTQEDSEKEGGLILSEMSEFVNSIGTEAVFTPREPARSVREAQAQAAEAEAQAEAAAAAAQATEQSIQEISTATTIQDVPEEGEAQDTHMEQPAESSLSSTTPTTTTEEEKTAIMEEPLVSGGMAATLSLLNQKGFISTPTQEQVERDRILSKRMRWIAEQKKLEAQREREREQEKLRQRERDHNSMRNSSRMDRDRAREREREREREKEIEEREDMREYMKRMEEYKPDVKLEYFDEHGHQMNTKEAFRFMSHKFHGKTSGKTKTEKRMAKLEEELKLNMMSNNDTPLNLATKLLERQQRTGNAHVVLSVGNRGVAAPSTSEMVASELAEPSSSPSSSTTKKSIKRGRVDDDHNDEPSDKKRK